MYIDLFSLMTHSAMFAVIFFFVAGIGEIVEEVKNHNIEANMKHYWLNFFLILSVACLVLCAFSLIAIFVTGK